MTVSELVFKVSQPVSFLQLLALQSEDYCDPLRLDGTHSDTIVG